MIAINGKPSVNKDSLFINGMCVELLVTGGSVIYRHTALSIFEESISFIDMGNIIIHDGRLNIPECLIEAMRPGIRERSIDFTDVSKVYVNDGMIDLSGEEMRAMEYTAIGKCVDFYDIEKFVIRDGTWNKTDNVIEVGV